MGRERRAWTGTGIIITSVGLSIAGLPTTRPLPNVHTRAIQLTGVDTADSPLGDGVALVVGPSGIQGQPPEGYVDAVDRLYLEPRGFTGTVQGVATPEALNPVTGPKSLTFDESAAQGQQILNDAILKQIHDGNASAENPVVVFGYSQSAVISAQLQQQLSDEGVPSDYVHFIMVADESVPDGGALSRFDLPTGANPSVPALGITFTGGQPSDLYPTDVYTAEYDGFADFPRYPIDELSTLNALLGIIFQHVTYADLSPEQIADAIQLPTSAADTLTNYYVVPDQFLPLLEPLLLFGSGGKALYDLLEPDMRILVDLGYGSITEGWNQGPADVPTPVGLWPTDISFNDLFTALANGTQKGFTDFVDDLKNPNLDHVAHTALVDALSPLLSGAHTFGFTDVANPSQLLTSLPELLELARNFLSEFGNYPISDATLDSSFTDLINDLSGTLSSDSSQLLPIADTVNSLLTSLPAVGVDVLADAFKDGHPLQGIEEVLGGIAGIIPFALAFGVVPPLGYGLGGTLINLVDLFDASGDASAPASTDAAGAAADLDLGG